MSVDCAAEGDNNNVIFMQLDVTEFSAPDKPCRILLTADGLELHRILSTSMVSTRSVTSYSYQCLTGCHAMRSKPDEHSDNFDDTENAFICVYAYHPKVKNSKTSRERNVLVLRVNRYDTFKENLEVVDCWRHAILKQIAVASFQGNVAPLALHGHPERKVLVIINPFSGTRRGPEIYKDRLEPIFREADLEWSCVTTDRANAARDMIAKDSSMADKYDAIFIIGGDGLLFEVLNGFLRQGRGLKALNEIPVAMIPGGSGNALAHNVSVLHWPSPLHRIDPREEDPILQACLNSVRALRGVPRPLTHPLDLMVIQTGSGKTMVSCLGLGWGLVPDIDIGSEKLRSLGDIRFTLWTIYRIFNMKSYKGRVSFLPCEAPASALNDSYAPYEYRQFPGADFTPPPVASGAPPTRSRSMFNLPKNELKEVAVSGNPDQPVPAESASSTSGDNFCDPTLQRIPPIDEPITDPAWTVIEGDFISAYASLVPWIDTKTPFVPYCRTDDGVIWLQVQLKKYIRMPHLLQLMMKLEEGKHVQESLWFCYPVRAVRIEPFSDGGYITVDGEKIDYGPVQAEIVPSGATILAANRPPPKDGGNVPN